MNRNKEQGTTNRGEAQPAVAGLFGVHAEVLALSHAEVPALSHAEVLGAWVGSFVDELVACGLRDVCLCPGSRSTPLAITFARHPDVKVWTHLDERSCAYFALGMAKARPAEPVAILCSSGTAAVNFAPAVVEAYHSRVPLIVLTADRPPELQDLGANQTIDQHRLYGPAVKWFSQLPLPEASPEMLRYVRMIAARAIATTQQAPMGPVHLDFLFREPLVPALSAVLSRELGSVTVRGEPVEPRGPRLDPRIPDDGAPPGDSRPSTGSGRTVWGAGSAQPRADLPFDVREIERPLIVAGPDAGVDAGVLLAVAERLGAPVLADALSGPRSLPRPHDSLLSAYDAFLRPPALCDALRPGFVLRLGDPPTSKPLATYLARHRDVPQYALARPGRWPDPDLSATAVLQADATAVCASMLEALAGGAPTSNGWLQSWRDAEERTRGVIDGILGGLEGASEVSAIADLAEALPDGSYVFAGNSMPVRDIDGFFATHGKQVTLLGSRGASGIDGVVSTALGIAARSDAPTTLVIGDLSFYHDMNGLLAAQRHDLSATIVLINNGGGGIFSFLPQHEQSEDFEMLFGTPHGLDFSHAGPLYGVGFQRVATRQEYRDALKASFEAPGVQVIEVRTDREENLKLHQRIWAAVVEAVTPIVVEAPAR